MQLPKGFQFSGVSCGIKKSGKLDVALVTTNKPAVAAGVYTQNVVRAASIDWNRDITPTDQFRAVIINSGNANACTGKEGVEENAAMAAIVAKLIDASDEQVCVLSTGVIGHRLPMDKIKLGIENAVSQQSDQPAGFENASQAILTTDQGAKTIQSSVAIGGQEVNICGMAKGAGMIGPNMATMLAIVLTDAHLAPQTAHSILQKVADASFNRISVEGHTSTNDALLLVCSGASNVSVESADEVQEFTKSLTASCIELAKRIPSDGEGATHLLDIRVSGADSVADADQVARTIAASALVKTAITGADPNWGRIVSAAGYSGVSMSADQINLKLNGHLVFDKGQPVDFDAAEVSQSIARQFETKIEIEIGWGRSTATHWTSDLTVDYVRFNSEYTT